MLTIHSIEDIHLIKKGQAGDNRWMELEIVTHEGILPITLWVADASNFLKKVTHLLELINKDPGPFRDHLPRFLDRKADPFAPLIQEYASWEKQQGFKQSMAAEERLFDESLTDSQRAWLADFCNRWDQLYSSAGAKG